MTKLCGKRKVDGSRCTNKAGCRINHPKPSAHQLKPVNRSAVSHKTDPKPAPNSQRQPADLVSQPFVGCEDVSGYPNGPVRQQRAMRAMNVAALRLASVMPQKPSAQSHVVTDLLIIASSLIPVNFSDRWMAGDPANNGYKHTGKRDFSLSNHLKNSACDALTFQPETERIVAHPGASTLKARFTNRACWRATMVLAGALQALDVDPAVAVHRAANCVDEFSGRYGELLGERATLTKKDTADYKKFVQKHVGVTLSHA